MTAADSSCHRSVVLHPLQKVVFVREAKSSEGARIDDDDEDVPATKKTRTCGESFVSVLHKVMIHEMNEEF
jgi:hypothetical protein